MFIYMFLKQVIIASFLKPILFDSYRYIFWTEGDSVSNSTIKRANLDGSGVVVIATGVVNPVAMAIDVVRLELYWISNSGRVSRGGFDGSHVEVIHESGSGSVFQGIAVFEDFIDLTNSANDTVIRINKLTKSECERVSECVLTTLITIYYTHTYTDDIVLTSTSSSGLGPIHVNHSLQQTINSSGNFK